MQKYCVTLTKTAKKQLDKLSDQIAEPLLKAISNLGDNPRPAGYKKLKGRNAYRVRVGNYRIIYEIFDTMLLIDVIALGKRSDIYRSI